MNSLRRLLMTGYAVCVLLGAAPQAVGASLTFDGETTGVKPQPYLVDGISISVVDFGGGGGPPSLRIVDLGPGGNGCAAGGKCLASGSDSIFDGAIEFTLPGVFTFFSIDFGNDDPESFIVGGLAAQLRAFSGGAEVGSNQLNANVDDLVNQTISVFVPGGFDSVRFRYVRPADGNPVALTKVVDNAVYDSRTRVPEPASAAILLGALGGLLRLRRRGVR